MSHARDRESPGPPVSGAGDFTERFERLSARVVEVQELLNHTQEALLALDDELGDLQAAVLAGAREQVSGERRIPDDESRDEERSSVAPDWLEREFEDALPEEDEAGDFVASPSPTGAVSGVRFVRESEELEFELASLLDEAETAERGRIEGESWDLDEKPTRSVSRITKKRTHPIGDPLAERGDEPEPSPDEQGQSASKTPQDERERRSKAPGRITSREVKRPSREHMQAPEEDDEIPRRRSEERTSTSPGDRAARRRRQKMRTSSRRDRLETNRRNREEPEREGNEIDSLLSEFLEE